MARSARPDHREKVLKTPDVSVYKSSFSRGVLLTTHTHTHTWAGSFSPGARLTSAVCVCKEDFPGSPHHSGLVGSFIAWETLGKKDDFSPILHHPLWENHSARISATSNHGAKSNRTVQRISSHCTSTSNTSLVSVEKQKLMIHLLLYPHVPTVVGTLSSVLSCPLPYSCVKL